MTPPARHSLLIRQLKRVFDDQAPPADLDVFIDVVDEAYAQFDDDRLMLERSLDLSSDELFHANTELRALFQALPDLVLRVAPDGRIVDVKPGYDRGLYLDADDLVGRRLQDDPIGTKEGSTEDVLLEVLARKELRTIQYEAEVAGKTKWYEARLLPYLTAEVLIVVRDITDRVKALKALTKAKAELETRVAARTAELRETNEALRAEIHEREEAESRRRRLEAKLLQAQKLESLGVLAGGIAHDFNNLLMAILGNASLGLDALSSDSPARRNLQEIEAATQRASGLTNQMLAYSGKGRFVVERIDISTVARSMADLLEVSISKKAKLVYEFFDQLPLVEADATQVGQVVMNLITNASESLGEEGGTVTLRTNPVAVDSEYLAECILGEDVEEGPFVAIEVSDDGEGMSEDTVAKIFDPFFTTKFTGRGLGLAAVLGIVRGHRGAIRVASAVGKGTRFTVLLPAVGGPTDGRPLSDREPDLKKDIVLVVDDDPAVRRVLRSTLENHGYRAVVAEDGRDGLSVFQRHVGRIVAVVLDMTMPVMDGRQAYEQIRAISPTLPVVIISGYARESAQKRFEDNEYLDFLQKPFLPRDLVACLDEFGEKSTRGHRPAGV
jgi:PAS domain S-box-containing protein